MNAHIEPSGKSRRLSSRDFNRDASSVIEHNRQAWVPPPKNAADRRID
jgi:hypothetical protein